MADEDQIKRIVTGLKTQTAAVSARIASTIQARLQATTPVDTGWARSQWVIRVGVDGFQGDGRPPKGLKRRNSQSIDIGQPGILDYSLDQGAITISNHAPYINKLNHGYSKQAPAHFVEAAIEAGILAGQGKGPPA